MSTTKRPQAQNPLILRFHRLMDAFAKSDDERDFYLDRVEGFILFADLDKGTEELENLEKELVDNKDRYCLIPKMSFYETKKFMEGFVNEKVYDIDTKEKLNDIIQAKEARENFLEFIYDHLTELEKWQQYYHERSRIRVIEWLREQEIQFVFEEDLDIVKPVMEKVKQHLFDEKVSKDVSQARQAIVNKSKTYYSNEALNPRPKRGRPPKQQAKVELEPQLTADFYTTVPPVARQFLFMPDYNSSGALFSSKFDSEAQLLASLKGTTRAKIDTKLEALSQRLESLRTLSERLKGSDAISGSKDQNLIDAVSEQTSKMEKAFSATKDESGKYKNLFEGVLPKEKEKSPRTSEDIQKMMVKKREAGIKSVTPLRKKKKKDSKE